MKFLLDTCVVSELWRPKPEKRVCLWLDQEKEAHLTLSVLVLGEIRKGVDALPSGKRKQALHAGFAKLCQRFDGRILDITQPIGERWGQLSAQVTKKGGKLHVIDGLIAATAAVHGLIVVTRNVDDFSVAGVDTHNPWAADPLR